MKIALITGANRGIGKAIALRLAQDKDITIVGTGINQADADSISALFAKHNIQGRGIVMDVRDPEQIASALDTIGNEYGPVTILVNNAGITQDNLLMRMKDNEWFDLIDVNLNSIYRISKACLRGMTKKRYGRIISITSVVGAMGNAGQTNYAAAKAGVMGFSKSLAREVGSRGITVNTVAPGFIETDMTKNLPEEHKTMLTSQITLGKLGQPEDVANAVAFLASDEAAYITGQTLHVNGGMYM
jgi:3-oxoacyl-[acyl-carrier protein] reductase